MKKFFLLLALLPAAVFIHAADNNNAPALESAGIHINGHVLDSETGEHVPFVSISLKGTAISVTSDAAGHFTMKGLPAGSFTVAARCMGYDPRETEIIIEEGKTYELNVTLDPAAVEINSVVVSANRTQSDRRHSATIVNVLSEGLFESTSSNTLSDALNYQSGLRVEMTCNNCGVPQLRINGLEGQYTQILLDSRPMFSSLAAVYGLEQLPVGMVERVEVIRGGGSALFGSSAIGGVVNIITKEPSRNMALLSNVTSFMGSSSDVNTTLNASLVSEDHKAGVYLFGMIRDRKSYDRDGDGYTDIPKLNSETIGFRGYYRTSDYTKLTAEYHHIREFRRGGDSLGRPPHQSNIAEQLRHEINGGGLRYDIFSRSNRHRTLLYVNYQDIKRDSYFGTHQNPDAYGNTTDKTFLAGGQYTYSAQRFLFAPLEITVGMEADNNRLHDVIIGYDRDMFQVSTAVGGFAQNEWKSEKVNLIIGARIDKHNKIDNVIFSPRANVRYTPVGGLILRAGYNSGFRAPQAYDEDLHVGAVGGEVYIIKLSPDLKPEYSNSVTASADYYASTSRVHHNFLLEGFYTNLKDAFTLSPEGHDNQGNLVYIRENASGAVIKGFNVEYKAALSDKNYLQLGYTWQHSRYKEGIEWSEDDAAPLTKRMLRTPDHYGYAVVNFSPVKDLQITLNGIYTGRMYVPHLEGYIDHDVLEKTPLFFEMGFRLAYDIGLSKVSTLQLNFGMKNITDTFQKDLDKGVDKDASYIYGPALPRTVFFGVRVSF